MVHLIQDSHAFLALLSLWALLAPTESLPPPVSAISGPTTQAARLEDRDINSICGFWLDSAGASIANAPWVLCVYIFYLLTYFPAWSWWCNSGEPCAIDTYATPNVVFCSQEALIPYTSWYDYGKWPAGGCGFQETCWSVKAHGPRHSCHAEYYENAVQARNPRSVRAHLTKAHRFFMDAAQVTIRCPFGLSLHRLGISRSS
jgi:hypothetical protein